MTTERKNFTHDPIDVGTGTTLVLAENYQRVWVLLVNDSDVPIYVTFGVAAVVNEGIRLNANGGSLELSYETGFIDGRQINAIHGDTGTKRLLATWG